MLLHTVIQFLARVAFSVSFVVLRASMQQRICRLCDGTGYMPCSDWALCVDPHCPTRRRSASAT